MISLKKAYRSDKDKLMPLILEGFEVNKNSKPIQLKLKSFFNQLFDIRWACNSEHIGYYLENEEQIPVGFNGYIFSKRKIGEKIYKLCNLTTWVVKKEYSRYGILLYKPVEKLKLTHIITNYSPSVPSQFVLNRMGFNILDQTKYLLPIIPHYKFLDIFKIKRKIDFTTINSNEKKIYNDHISSKIIFLQYFKNHKNLLIGCKRVYKRRIPFLEIMYLNNKDLFYKNIQVLRSILNLKFNTLGLIIDSRFLDNKKINLSLKLKTKGMKLIYSKNIDTSEIDNLYSELIFISV